MIALVGDSNTRRHMNPQNCRDRPPMASAQVKTCGKLEALSEVLRSLSSQVTICILACVTNFLTSIEGASSSASVRVQPILFEFRDVLLDYCSEQPERLAYFNQFVLSLVL